MTKNKRFTVEHIMFDGYCIFDNIDDKYYDYDKNDLNLLCDVLNELHEENYILKKKNKSLKEHNNKLLIKPFLTDILPEAIEIMSTNKKLEKENEKLSFQNSNLMKEVAEYSRKAKELEKKNNQLKQQLKDKEIEWLRNNTIWEQMPSSHVPRTTLSPNQQRKGDDE